MSAELLTRAARDGTPWLAASVVRGPFVALGAHQRASRVVDLAACAREGVPVYRRATAGTAFYAGPGSSLVFTLALPHVAALAADATPRTLINRNVRGFLQGLTRCGTPAHYFGREWISLRHRPGALVGYECTEAGAVLLEVLAGYERSMDLPVSLCSPEEHAMDRWNGREPIGLREAFGPGRDAAGVAARVAEGCAARWSQTLEPAGSDLVIVPAPAVARGDEPAPAGARWLPGRSCAIGWIDAAHVPASGDAWLGGDVLAPRFALDALARASARGDDEPEGFALDGATLEELRDALRG